MGNIHLRQLIDGTQVDFHYRDKNGDLIRFRRRIGPRSMNKRVAMQEAKRLQSEANRLGFVPGYDDPPESPIGVVRYPFKDFARHWFDTYVRTHNKPSECANKESVLRVHLVPFFQDTDLRDINTRVVEEFKAVCLKKGLSKKSVNNYLGVLRKLLNVARDWDYVDVVPRIEAFKEEPRDPEFFKMEERDKFLAVCKQKRPEWYAYFVVGFHTGMRAGELAALKWEDVDFFNRSIRIRRNVWRGHVGSPKSGKFRDVPMNDFLYDTLMAHRHPGENVFYTTTGRPLDINAGRKVMKTVCRYAGLRAIRRHDIRHSFASAIASETGNILAIKDLLGHADYSTTMRYAHLTPAKHRECVAAIDTGGVDKLSHGRSEQLSVNGTVNRLPEGENPTSRFKEKARKFNHLRALRNESG